MTLEEMEYKTKLLWIKFNGYFREWIHAFHWKKKKENDMRVNAKLLFFSALSLLNSCLFIQIADQTIYVLF